MDGFGKLTDGFGNLAERVDRVEALQSEIQQP
jgi:hypothetical protein